VNAFLTLLKDNRNYRYTWMGQVVSEVGDHFNNIAVFSLALKMTGSGMAVTWVMMARAIPAVMAGPVAGVVLDRLNRRWVMILSDLVRGCLALGFILTVDRGSPALLYVLSALLMFASPFFTSGRASILPSITTQQELHTANSLTQTTQWTTLTIGAFLAGVTAMQFGFKWAFVLNATSFFFSAYCIWHLKLSRGGFEARPGRAVSDKPWLDYREGLRYMKARPLILGVALINIGWATGGGAAQILFTLFGEVVFGRGPAGLGIIWGSAGAGLVLGGIIGHRLGPRLSFRGYKLAVTICYVIHGSTYVLFSQMPELWQACVFMAASRVAMAVSSVLNFSKLLKHVSNEYRGRVFATLESLTWSVMMLSMMGAGMASSHTSARTIGAAAGVLSSLTALWWGYADWSGRLPEPVTEDAVQREVEARGTRGG
jgi:MFS family permease